VADRSSAKMAALALGPGTVTAVAVRTAAVLAAPAATAELILTIPTMRTRLSASTTRSRRTSTSHYMYYQVATPVTAHLFRVGWFLTFFGTRGVWKLVGCSHFFALQAWSSRQGTWHCALKLPQKRESRRNEHRGSVSSRLRISISIRVSRAHRRPGPRGRPGLIRCRIFARGARARRRSLAYEAPGSRDAPPPPQASVRLPCPPHPPGP
jgi:hypothetical protein